jgi:hypothetical protein
VVLGSLILAQYAVPSTIIFTSYGLVNSSLKIERVSS